MKTNSTITVGIVTALAVGLVSLLGTAGASASTICDVVAAPGGNDSAQGSAEAPLRTADALLERLPSGQTGCFRAGTYSQPELKISTPGVTVTSYPGETATIKGRIWVAGNGVTMSDLMLDGRNARHLPSPTTNAANVVFTGLDVTNYHTDICFKIGDADYGRAIHTIIQDSRIHDCGELPSNNMEHGIYVGQADGTIIRNNFIYDNTDRGIQLYPDARGSVVTGNVIDGNGEGVAIGGDGNTAASGNVIRGNVISNSKLRWNIEASWPNSVVGSSNIFRENCIFSSNGTSSGYYDQDGGVLPRSEGAEGFTTDGNFIAAPQFKNRAAGDLTVTGGPCARALNGDLSDQAASPTPITLQKAQAAVTNNPPVVLFGKVRRNKRNGRTPRRVKFLVLAHGSWHRLRSTHVRRGGGFKLRTRLRVSSSASRVRIRAVAPGIGKSRSVSVRLSR